MQKAGNASWYVYRFTKKSHYTNERFKRRTRRQKTAARKSYQFKQGTRKKMSTFVAGTLGVGEGMQEAVKLPQGENLNEWLSVHVVDFMNEVSLLYGIIAEFDTAEKFPVMSAGEFTYKWSDETTKKPLSVSAPQYVENLFNWIERQLNDEKIFPVDVDKDFPKDFRKRVKHIFSRLFRVYAHIYCSHMRHIEAQHAEKHVNSSMKHFVLFALEFNLLRIQELQPVRKILNKLIGKRIKEVENAARQGKRKESSASESVHHVRKKEEKKDELKHNTSHDEVRVLDSSKVSSRSTPDDGGDEEDKSLARRTESLDHQENGGGCCILQ